jgi:hypothetical protein
MNENAAFFGTWNSGRIDFSPGELIRTGLERVRKPHFPPPNRRLLHAATAAAELTFPNVTGVPPRLSPPPDLAPDERQVFLDLISSVRPEHFRACDSPLLAAYCRAIALERKSSLQLDDKAGLMRWERATKAMVALSMRLRLSPQSRQANSSRPGAKPERPLSYYERQALEETGDGRSA